MMDGAKRQLNITLALMAAAAVFLCLVPGTAGATIERLVMPGEVIKGHAKYENECSRCHKPFSKESQRTLCLDCHKEISEDVSKKKGFHGLDGDARESECRKCHPDHKGRGADVVRFDRVLFDHNLTDYPLKGAHAGAKCAGCHNEKKKFRDTVTKCMDCHKANDVHKGKLGRECSNCHDEKTWVKARFNHGKTKFALKGKHEEIDCKKCHPGEGYKKTPTDCYSCHVFNDLHAGRYGKKCERCHTEKNWDKPTFDHDKTDFRLEDKHRDLKCDQCHLRSDYNKKLEKTCNGCHKNDDKHLGRYGNKCENCHKGREWKKTTFDHEKTEYKLKEKHRDAICDACHKGPLYNKKTPKTCNGCHKTDDVHRGQQGKYCDRCHNEKGWRVKVAFDHDVTAFPLIGLHAVTPCEQCHTARVYKNTTTVCSECHKSNDVHERGLGVKCERCHNPNDWRLWKFDHNKQSKFKLEGAHLDVECRSCHHVPVKDEIRLRKDCVSCHAEDDIHMGGFGRYCDRCHVNSSFKDIKLKPFGY